MKYQFRGTNITELDDDRLRTALEKHQNTEPRKPEDFLVYQALVAEWNKRYEAREKKYKEGK
jgi:hypothetical protein|tara:strand:- start:4501 stop:4686 length:186 start_codon:yes stop_codon:yes gene_type:complete